MWPGPHERRQEDQLDTLASAKRRALTKIALGRSRTRVAKAGSISPTASCGSRPARHASSNIAMRATPGSSSVTTSVAELVVETQAGNETAMKIDLWYES